MGLKSQISMAFETPDLMKGLQYKPERIMISNSDNWMVVIGDSAATGAVASPDIKATLNLIGKAFSVLTHPEIKMSDAHIKNISHPEAFALDSNLIPPSRIYFSKEEVESAKKLKGWSPRGR